MPLITILTPTYNRKDLLDKCYKSLLKQNSYDFEWLIVDDGSIDNTEEVVKKYISEDKINIKYIYKTNGGKHSAINLGVKKIETILTLILDSDDYLMPNAIERIKDVHLKYENTNNICGYTFLKVNQSGKLIGDPFPKNGIYNFIKWRVNGVVSGDHCDVLFTNRMIEFPFSEYPMEKFIGESTAWIRMGLKYDMVAISEPIYIADYLEGGLTKKGRKLRVECPMGGMEYANLCILKQCSWKRKLKYAPVYMAYGLIAPNVTVQQILKNSNSKVLTFLVMPFSLLLAVYWQYKYEVE